MALQYTDEEWGFVDYHKDLIMIRPCRIKCENENNEDEVAGLLYVEDGKVVFRPACTEEKIILEVRDAIWRDTDEGQNQEFFMCSKEYKIPFTNLTYSFQVWLEYEIDQVETDLPVSLTVRIW